MRCATTTVPREEWEPFFDAFSRSHKGWDSSLELCDDEGFRVEARNLSFEGLVFESAARDHWALNLIFGDDPDRHISHMIDGPIAVHVSRLETERGTNETLRVESWSGSEVVVKFDVALTPDMFNRVA